jgi:predicted phosphodiesterase
VGRSSEALEVAANGRLDMVLTGHLHHGVTHQHDHLQRSMLVVQAGTATSHRIRGEPNSYNVIQISRERLRFSVRIWDGKAFREDRVAEYDRQAPDWRPIGPVLAKH